MTQRRPVKADSMSAHSRSMSETSSEPEDALMELLAPDGYYSYLGIAKDSTHPLASPSGPKKAESEPLHSPLSAAPSNINEDLIKKNYRKLSRKHHPDRPGGNVETFRLLHRAQVVLLNPKLRQQYDILGIDLDDEHEEDDEEHDIDATDNEKNGSDAKKKHQERPSSSQSIVQDIASSILAVVMQVIVRTVLMAFVACAVVRYRLLLYPSLIFMCYIVVRIIQIRDLEMTWTGEIMAAMVPVGTIFGLVAMHYGRTATGDWTIWFWMGEATVIGGFTFHSITALPATKLVMLLTIIFSTVVSLWFRGKFWSYAIVFVMEALLALFVVLAFPIFEFILESILNEKLKKVGEKVRAHHALLEKHYESKLTETRESNRK